MFKQSAAISCLHAHYSVRILVALMVVRWTVNRPDMSGKWLVFCGRSLLLKVTICDRKVLLFYLAGQN